MAAPGVVTLLLVLVLVAVVPTLQDAGPPPDPTTPAECVAAGGVCLARSASGEPACPSWQRPFPGACGRDSDCCFIDYTNHRLRCGLFGGDCAPSKSCGRAPRHPNAYCPNKGDDCCIWLY